MSVLDDEGRLFGLVNIVDALLALGALALVVGVFALHVPGDTAATQQAAVTIETDVHPSVTDALREEAGSGPIRDVGRVDRVTNATTDQRQHRVRVTAVVDIRRNRDRLYEADRQPTERFRLAIGQRYTLDTPRVKLTGTIVDIEVHDEQ